jgi:hypothetical protein
MIRTRRYPSSLNSSRTHRVAWVFLAAGLAVLLGACDPMAFGSGSELTARSGDNTSSSGPNCAACHGNPPHDILHTFHLTSYVVNRDNMTNLALNGPVTCMDCHFGAVRHFSYVHADSMYIDTNGGESTTRLSPSDSLVVTYFQRYRPVPYPGIDSVHAESSAKSLDSLILIEARAGRLVRWMTGFAHLDGKRSVEYAPNNLDGSALLDTSFRRGELSCSAVACHNRAQLRYRFASPARGISACPSLTKHDTTCGEPAP